MYKFPLFSIAPPLVVAVLFSNIVLTKVKFARLFFTAPPESLAVLL